MTETRQLARSTSNRWVGGVCAGLADYLRIDPTVVRVLTVVAALFSVGAVGLAYVIAWILVPEAGSSR